jgi:tetratricopeptide (TPR) repeat protein
MVLAATLAVVLAERLDPDFRGSAPLADLQACALAELGNARRIADDLAGAESDLSRAVVRAQEGTGDPLFLARLMDFTASLYTDQRRFDEARLLLDAVYAIYERAGDRHLAGRTLISKGVSAQYAFDIEEAIRLLGQGLSMIDAAQDPKLAMIGIHNLVWSFVECGRADQARQLFEQSHQLYPSHIEPLDAIKVTWLEGRIAAALGEDRRAEQRFREARVRFEEAKLPYEVALVSLDTASLWLREGRTAEIKELIDETISIFQARGIRREAIGMLLVVREAFQKDQATEAMLRRVAAQLQMDGIPARRGRVSS